MLSKATKVIKLTGKQYKSVLVNTTVEVTHLLEVECQIKTDLEERIWNKRKCFVCGDKFKDGDKLTAAITKKGKNKILCKKCAKELKGVK